MYISYEKLVEYAIAYCPQIADGFVLPEDVYQLAISKYSLANAKVAIRKHCFKVLLERQPWATCWVHGWPDTWRLVSKGEVAIVWYSAGKQLWVVRFNNKLIAYIESLEELVALLGRVLYANPPIALSAPVAYTFADIDSIYAFCNRHEYTYCLLQAGTSLLKLELNNGHNWLIGNSSEGFTGWHMQSQMHISNNQGLKQLVYELLEQYANGESGGLAVCG